MVVSETKPSVQDLAVSEVSLDVKNPTVTDKRPGAQDTEISDMRSGMPDPNNSGVKPIIDPIVSTVKPSMDPLVSDVKTSGDTLVLEVETNEDSKVTDTNPSVQDCGVHDDKSNGKKQVSIVKSSQKISKVSDVRSSQQNRLSYSSVPKEITANSENTRKIIAEDLLWSLGLVPMLKDLVLNHIVANFNRNPLLKKLHPKDKDYVLERLPTDIPLQITADLINDEGYWERCCKSRWEVCDVSFYTGSWKRLFFERHLEGLIENYIPLKTDNFEMRKAIELSAKYVKRLIIRQLLPPVADPPPEVEDAMSDYGSDSSLNTPSMDHFEFTELAVLKRQLEELRVKYGVRNCGMNFEWKIFKFSYRDCALLATFVKNCQNLKCLCLQESKVDDERCRVLVRNFLDHPSLQKLNLSHNCIRNRGARAVAKLINNRCPNLMIVDLYDNEIRGPGARAIAFALKKNRQLEDLNLRLNRIGNEGAEAICGALISNTSLRSVNLACNDFGEPTAAVLSRALQCNTALRSLVISGNVIGKDGGKQLQAGMEANNTLIELDIRLTDAGRDSEYFIAEKLTANEEKHNVKNMK